jgi:hypothetical protein
MISSSLNKTCTHLLFLERHEGRKCEKKY